MRAFVRPIRLLFLLTVLMSIGSPPVLAQGAAQATGAEDRQREVKAAIAAAEKAGTNGPADVRLLDQATMHLPAAMRFVPPEEAARLLRAFGNRVLSNPVGLVYGTRGSDDWFVVVRFVKDGYIKDDDARDWNADELLKSLRDGTEEANQDRVSRGFAELEIIGWIAPPKYDFSTHRLVWSLAQKDKGEPTQAVQGVNYNTNALGREGHFSLNLVTDSAQFPSARPLADALMNGLIFDNGKRYEDFNGSTDHVAEYGLAALIGVVAAKKLGLLALVGVFLLKFAKVGALIALGGAAAVAKFFRGRKPGGNV